MTISVISVRYKCLELEIVEGKIHFGVYSLEGLKAAIEKFK